VEELTNNKGAKSIYFYHRQTFSQFCRVVIGYWQYFTWMLEGKMINKILIKQNEKCDKLCAFVSKVLGVFNSIDFIEHIYFIV
jgi:hypothetical protein